MAYFTNTEENRKEQLGVKVREFCEPSSMNMVWKELQHKIKQPYWKINTTYCRAPINSSHSYDHSRKTVLSAP